MRRLTEAVKGSGPTGRSLCRRRAPVLMQHAKNPRRSEGRSHGGKPCPATTPQPFAGTGRLPDNDCEPDRNATEPPWRGGSRGADNKIRTSGLTLARYTDLRRRPETTPDLKFWLITGSRHFALFCDVSRPVRGLRTSGHVAPVAAGNGRPTGPVSALSESVSPTPRDRRLHPGNWPQGDPAGPAGRRRHLP